MERIYTCGVYGTEFCAIYDENITDPDLGVRYIEDITTYIEEKTAKMQPRLKEQEKEKEITKFDIRVTCHLILISMNKTFIATADRD